MRTALCAEGLFCLSTCFALSRGHLYCLLLLTQFFTLQVTTSVSMGKHGSENFVEFLLMRHFHLVTSCVLGRMNGSLILKKLNAPQNNSTQIEICLLKPPPKMHSVKMFKQCKYTNLSKCNYVSKRSVLVASTGSFHCVNGSLRHFEIEITLIFVLLLVCGQLSICSLLL